MTVRFFLTAIIITAAVIYDKKQYKVPNELIALGIVSGVAMIIWDLFWGREVIDYVMGFGITFAILFVFFVLRVIGAGDVKLMMVIGLICGWNQTIEIMKWTGVITVGIAFFQLFMGKTNVMEIRGYKLHKMHMTYGLCVGFWMTIFMELWKGGLT